MYKYLFLSIIFLMIYLNRLEAGDKAKSQENLDYLKMEFEYHYLEENMNSIFPEGAIFAHAMYGLSWCNMVSDSTAQSWYFKKAVKESLSAYNSLNQNHVRSQFDREANPEYGIFYAGWRNYLLANICKVYPNSKLIQELRINTTEIIRAYQQNDILFLQSYPGAIWPADNLAAIASVSIYNQIYPDPEITKFLDEWLIKFKNQYKDTEELIPHASDGYGRTETAARGSSMSLMLVFLHDIDREFGEELYPIYLKDFKRRGMITGIREYRRGESGSGDIDSGPVVAGIGFSATIVGIGTCELYGDHSFSKRILAQANVFESKDDNGRDRYLKGAFPMGDLFILWSETMKYRVD